jgi:release factor glutamine methyltransferase
MSIDEWLKNTSTELADAMIPSARLDAEIILSHTLNKPRTWLHAHGDDEIDTRRNDIANARAELRLERVPIAYIIGHKYFYGRRFTVSPATLIPRPESEDCIDLAKMLLSDRTAPLHIVDVGTGSGCLGITAGLELPTYDLCLSDTSKDALRVAEKNAIYHGLTPQIISSNLLDSYPLKADLVLANLPYVDESWPHISPELDYEPHDALYAKKAGLACIFELLQQLPQKLTARGIAIVEADPVQHQRIIAEAVSHQLCHVKTHGFALALTL